LARRSHQSYGCACLERRAGEPRGIESLLEPLILKMQPLSVRIVLFGSASRGEDAASSDIDLFILSKDSETIGQFLASFKTDRKIQPIILEPAEWPDFREREKVFFEEIEKGIVLWEEQD